MSNLTLHEQFEIETLNLLHTHKLLDTMIFCGGTMLRLCFELNRYSTDLDFWLPEDTDADYLFDQLLETLEKKNEITDSKNKQNTLLFELRNGAYPMKLKIEIRKNTHINEYAHAIAFSHHSTIQVPIKVIPLPSIMEAKIQALLSRKEVRDAFDIEFLIRRGIALPNNSELLKKIKRALSSFTKHDINTKLGSLLPPDIRKVYQSSGFSFLSKKLDGMLQELRD